MSIRPGPPPSDPEQRRRRNAAVADSGGWTEVEGAPVGPREMPDGDWSPETVDYWDRATAGPVARMWLDTDWLSFERATRLHEVMIRAMRIGDVRSVTAIASGLRTLEANLGFTVADRKKLAIRVKAPAPTTETAPRTGYGAPRRTGNVVELRPDAEPE